MLDKFVKPGSKVVFYKEPLQEYNLKVQKILSDFEVIIIDDNDDSSLQLDKNKYYTLDFYARSSVYKCSVYITSIYIEDKHKCYKVRLDSPLKKEDRRRYQRYPCHSLISYSVLQKSQVKDIMDNGLKETWQETVGTQWFKHASLEDIGGGGLRITSRQRLEKGEYLTCIMDFAEYSNKLKKELNFTLICEVVHMKKLYSERNLFDVRLKYIGITEQQRDEIIRFVFWLERQRI